MPAVGKSLPKSGSERPIRIAVDIGGTFTDLHVFDARTNQVQGWKIATMQADPSLGLTQGLREGSDRFDFALADVGLLMHGTTVATNAVLERKLIPPQSSMPTVTMWRNRLASLNTLNSMGAALRTLLDRHVDAKSWGPGDVVVANDPYCGAQHLNDLLVFTPVFHDGQRVAYVGALCHHLDVGGMAPGSYAATATEVFQEGLRLPPVRLIEGGNLNEAVLAIIGQNVRKPVLMLGDLQSQTREPERWLGRYHTPS